ncbi:unnamed protein product [Urochloa decumbens]|uniref:Uncharacterized protein n=1 Tax=Urochloa decumbens TaxID=240449 RepID=A0ABC9C0P0_9POAL
MEATALSVGKAVLDGVVGYAKSFVSEEIALQLGVERDVIFIVDELEMMQSFLMIADEEHDKHKVLLTWVKQVRETAYNVEDNLMDYALHSEKKRIFCWWCIPCTLWERRNVAKEVKELRAKVEDVSNRHMRYRLIKASGSKLTTAAEEQANVATVAMLGINEATRTAMKLENSVVDLRQLITSEDKDRSVVAVWGASADLRTTAVQDVYDDPAVRANFGFRAWVKLEHPFDPKEFINSLVRQYYQNFPDVIGDTQKRTTGIGVLVKMENMSQSEMLDFFDTKVSDNSYLIVVDDVSTKEEWDCIENYFPDNKQGSRVIVSMQNAEIARLCTEKERQLSELKQSSYNQSVYLFHKKVMTSSNSRAPTSSLNTLPTDENGQRRTKFDEVFLGRTSEESEVTELVGQPDDKQGCKVISVWGMGGLGKTSLVQSVYRTSLPGGWKRAWATALRPFNPEQVIRKLAADLFSKSTEKKITKLEDLADKLTTFLQKEKCLVVLDDISSNREWDLVNNSLKDARRIIVTTREKSIAKHCSKEYKNMYNLKGLKDDIALELFKKKVFKDEAEETKLFPDMIEQARLILKKCDGLPLAITTIGGFLATKPKTATEWRKTYDRISTEMEINQELRTIKTVLIRSYDGLPYHLKSCFLYLSVFPEDYKIKRKQLIRRWGAIRHLAISKNWEREEDMYRRNQDLSHVRSLTVFGNWESFFISKKMRYLRVMDLSGTYGLEDHHLSHIGDLIHLKYLSLRRCEGIRHLPNSLGNLSNLQTLDIRDTKVWKLPPNITNLRKLRFFRADDKQTNRQLSTMLLKVKHGMSVHEEGRGLKAFSQLYELRKLGIDRINDRNSKEFWSAISSLNHLGSLSVNWLADRDERVLDYSLGGNLLPPRSIESLKLGSRVVRLKEWIHQLRNLSTLHLWCTELRQDAIQAVGKSPNLAILVMRDYSFMEEEFVFEQGSFPSLVLLELNYIHGTSFVKFDDETVSKLEVLRIVGWRDLKELSGLRYLTELKEIQLDLRRFSDKFKDNVQEQLVGHPNNVRVLRK